MRSKVQNGSYYDFEHMLIKIIDGNYRILEIVDSRIRLNNNLNFKLVYNLIRP